MADRIQWLAPAHMLSANADRRAPSRVQRDGAGLRSGGELAARPAERLGAPLEICLARSGGRRQVGRRRAEWIGRRRASRLRARLPQRPAGRRRAHHRATMSAQRRPCGAGPPAWSPHFRPRMRSQALQGCSSAGRPRIWRQVASRQLALHIEILIARRGPDGCGAPCSDSSGSEGRCRAWRRSTSRLSKAQPSVADECISTATIPPPGRQLRAPEGSPEMMRSDPQADRGHPPPSQKDRACGAKRPKRAPPRHGRLTPGPLSESDARPPPQAPSARRSPLAANLNR